MQSTPINEIISSAIDQAAASADWSLAKLARHLGMGQNRLLRWRQGSVAKYELEHVVELFRLAGLSMDQAFGLELGEPGGGQLHDQLADLRHDVGQLQNQLGQLRPSASLLAAFAQAFGELSAAGSEAGAEALMAERAAAYSRVSALRRSGGDAEAAGERLARKRAGAPAEKAPDEIERGA